MEKTKKFKLLENKQSKKQKSKIYKELKNKINYLLLVLVLILASTSIYFGVKYRKLGKLLRFYFY